MASFGDIHSILYKGDILKPKEPTYDASKRVKRYFPGKVPVYATEWSTTGDDDKTVEKPELENSPVKDTIESSSPTEHDKSSTSSMHERRLQLLQRLNASGSGVAERSKKRRQVIEQGTFLKRGEDKVSCLAKTTITLTVGQSHEKENQDSTSEEASRENKRVTALKSRIEEEKVLQILEKKNIEECVTHLDDQDSDVSDSTEDNYDVARPVFIPAAERSLMKSPNESHEDGSTLQESLQDRLAERRNEAKELLVSVIAEEEEQTRLLLEAQQKAKWDPDALPDDDDTVNEEAEYELWKIREMQRIIRNREEEEKRQAFLKEIERRRNLEEEERQKDDARLDALRPKAATSSKYSFMQKYYHKGAFFQDLTYSGEEPLYLRDFNVPVGEDRIDKTALPKPMRLRRDQFGKAGQVKHTHLADVDTTDFSFAWSKPIDSKTRSKMAGLKMENQFERPSAKKK